MHRVKQVLSVLVAVVVLFVALPFSASALSTVTSGKYRVSIATKQGFAAGGVTKIAATGASFTVPASGPYVIKLSSGFFSLGGAYSPSYELYTMEGGKKTVLATQEAGGDASGVAGSWEHSISAGTLNKSQKYYMSFSLSIAGVLNFASLDCYAESTFSAEEYNQAGRFQQCLYEDSGVTTDYSVGISFTCESFIVPTDGQYQVYMIVEGQRLNKFEYRNAVFRGSSVVASMEVFNNYHYSHPDIPLNPPEADRKTGYNLEIPYKIPLYYERGKSQHDGFPLYTGVSYSCQSNITLRSKDMNTPVGWWRYRVVLERIGGEAPDVSHREITHTSGGESRGGGAGRRDWYTVEYPDPEDPTKTIRKDTGELNILDEANKTVNLVTNSGNETYTYTDSSYNPTTNTTTVTTTTGDRITITSEENQVYVSKTDNSGNTTIYNYYYTSPEGGSGGSGSGGGGSGGGGGSDGGFSWDWLWDLIKGVGSFLLNLIGTLGSLLGDALSAVTGLFDFIGSFVGFIGGAFSFIPAEIWTLIGAGIAVSIVLRFLKR